VTALLTAGAILALYMLPTLIAAGRKVPNVGSILVINLFLGWTFIGWVVALAMAARSVQAKPNWSDRPIWPPPPPPGSES
jgi:Zn-dependent protease with chaperone function